ncbi:ATP-binding protein [Streptomyces sp. NPDC052701]|uniref:ATP-binding protein n=1 Tax=Streptomyces sp. NPDC052701 TaxID=3155533 RepID=UPI00342785E7
MKQSAARTLGVAALGAAFAAAGTGAANAAPSLPDAGRTLDTVTRTLPAETVPQALPGGGQALEQGRSVAGSGLGTAAPVARQVVGQQLSQGPARPVAGLLGGLPVQGLPTQGTPVNGIPLG